MRSAVTAAILSVCFSAPLSAQLLNGGFEEATGGAIPGWTRYGDETRYGEGEVVSGNYFGMTPAEGNNYWAVVRAFSASAPPGNQDGLFQIVPTAAGAPYTLSASVQAHNRYRPNEPEANRFVYIPGDPADTGDTDVRIGYDPTGGTDPNAPTVIYSGFTTTGAQWQTLSLDFIAAGPSTTLFLDSSQVWALDGHWSGFDNVTLVPEPAIALPLALSLLALRRRHFQSATRNV